MCSLQPSVHAKLIKPIQMRFLSEKVNIFTEKNKKPSNLFRLTKILYIHLRWVDSVVSNLIQWKRLLLLLLFFLQPKNI